MAFKKCSSFFFKGRFHFVETSFEPVVVFPLFLPEDFKGGFVDCFSDVVPLGRCGSFGAVLEGFIDGFSEALA